MRCPCRNRVVLRSESCPTAQHGETGVGGVGGDGGRTLADRCSNEKGCSCDPCPPSPPGMGINNQRQTGGPLTDPRGTFQRICHILL